MSEKKLISLGWLMVTEREAGLVIAVDYENLKRVIIERNNGVSILPKQGQFFLYKNELWKEAHE